MAFCVVRMTDSGKYRVRKKEDGVWEYLNSHYSTLDYTCADNSTPVEFDTLSEATIFMKRAHDGPRPLEPEFTIVDWIGEKA